MSTATQATGTTAEAASFSSTVQTAGFQGWTPEANRAVYTVVGASTYTVKGAYGDNTAYAVNDLVTYNGEAYIALQSVAGTNTVKPVAGAVWRQASNHRGAAEVTSPTSPILQFYR